MKQLAVSFTACLCILFAQQARGQEKSEIIQQRIEFISEQLQAEELDLTNLIEQLNYYYGHPLNLNTATEEELNELSLLTPLQVNSLLLHRKLFGKFISIYELQSIESWDLATIQLVLPFVRVGKELDNLHVSWREALKYGKSEAFVRYQRILEHKNGYTKLSDSVLNTSNNYYQGNADHYYTRLRFSYRTNVSIGITGEKDPGEAFFRTTQRNGFDFYSAHAFYKGGKRLKAIALGDYQLQIGQGLNLWSGYAFGKTADVTNVKKTAIPLKPYTSVDESRFMRGAAIDLGFGAFSLTSFASVKKIDASVLSDSLYDDLEVVSTLSLTGLHRTTGELAKKHQLIETIIGSNLRYCKGNFRIGFTGTYQGYDKAYTKATSPYNQFDFRGKSMYTWGADYSWSVKNMLFFGEVAQVSFSKAWAQLHGALLALAPGASLSVVYRDYQRDYQTFYNTGFSEGSTTQNERGLYAGLKFKLRSVWSIQAYCDLFQFPWMKYQVNAPSIGHELLVQPTYKPTKQLEVYVRYREQLRQKNSRNNDGTITELENVIQRNLRFNASYAITNFVTLKTRLEYVFIKRPSNTPEQGMIITQDVLFHPMKFPFDLTLRYALFDTDSYDSRLYTYENNALYTFSIPAYYYQGSRAYVLLHYNITKHFEMWLRYGAFIYNNRSTLSSGAEQINGNVKSDLTVQLRATF